LVIPGQPVRSISGGISVEEKQRFVLPFGEISGVGLEAGVPETLGEGKKREGFFVCHQAPIAKNKKSRPVAIRSVLGDWKLMFCTKTNLA
jgi:hypothetical protein